MKTFPLLAVAAAFCAAVGGASAAVPPEPEVVVSGRDKTVVFTTEAVVSSDSEIKAGESHYRHVTIAHASAGISNAFHVGSSSTLTLGLTHAVTVWEVSEPAGWEDDDFWKEYKRTHPGWDRVPLPSQLHSLSASLELNQQVNERWSYSTCIAQGSHAEGDSLLSKGWATSASLMALYEYSPELTLAFGLAYDSYSHDYGLVPILGFNWRPNGKWSLALGFPATAVTYRLNRHVAFSLEATGSGGTFYVAKDPEPGISPRSLDKSKLETTEVRLGFKVDWTINDTFSLNATAGHVLYREYKYVGRGFRLKSRDAPAFFSVGGSIAL